jgi:hypothetical protein
MKGSSHVNLKINNLKKRMGLTVGFRLTDLQK